MLRKIAKFFGWLVGSAVTLIIIFYLVVLAINWRDAPPSAEAQRFAQLYETRPRVADGQNAFVYMVGMAVADGLDPQEAGRAMVARSRMTDVKDRAIGYDHPDYPEIDFFQPENRQLLELREVCRTPDEKCVELLVEGVYQQIELDANDTLLRNRYRTMLELPGWQDIFPQGLMGPIPSYAPVMNGQLLSMLDILQKCELRNPAETIALLERDVRFWRTVLSSSDSLITSMVATAALKRNLFWTNVVLRALAARKIIYALPAAWLEPITDDERLLVRAWAGEMALTEQLVRETPEAELFRLMWPYAEETTSLSQLGVWLTAPLFLPQDSLNRNAKLRASLITAFSVSLEQLPGVVAQMKVKPLHDDDDGMSFPRILFNPVGKFWEVIEPPNVAGYMVRVSDLEGGRRALLAVQQLRADKTPREKIGDALALSPYRNPYTNQPLLWDELSMSVVFEGLDEGKRQRYPFAY